MLYRASSALVLNVMPLILVVDMNNVSWRKESGVADATKRVYLEGGACRHFLLYRTLGADSPGRASFRPALLQREFVSGAGS